MQPIIYKNKKYLYVNQKDINGVTHTLYREKRTPENQGKPLDEIVIRESDKKVLKMKNKAKDEWRLFGLSDNERKQKKKEEKQKELEDLRKEYKRLDDRIKQLEVDDG